jgi:hypothetical protein
MVSFPINVEKGLGLGLPLETIFQLYRGVQFLLVEETGVPGKNHQPVACQYKLYHIMLYRVHIATRGIRTVNFSENLTSTTKQICLSL